MIKAGQEIGKLIRFVCFNVTETVISGYFRLVASIIL